MRITSVAVVAGLMAAAGSLSAAAAVGDRVERGGRGGGEGAGLIRLDANKDGAVTLDEFVKKRADRFGKLDMNGDGSLDATELTAQRDGRLDQRYERMSKRLDKDSDGKVSRDEYDNPPQRAAATTEGEQGAEKSERRKRWSRRGGDRTASPERRAAMFTLLDANADGAIETTEFTKAATEQADYAKRRTMHRLDKDRDGKVTLDEFTAAAKERFGLLDLDGNGSITAEDMPPMARVRWAKQ